MIRCNIMTVYFGKFSNFSVVTSICGDICQESDLIVAGDVMTVDETIMVLIAYKNENNINVIWDEYCPCCYDICDIDQMTEVMYVEEFIVFVNDFNSETDKYVDEIIKEVDLHFQMC